MAELILKKGHIQAIWAGHPWVYAQAVSLVQGGATRGEEIDVLDPQGKFLGRGFYSPGSAIATRILTRNKDTALNAAFFRERLSQAISFRQTLGLPSKETTGYRLVHAEGDFLPGLIVDRFGDTLSVQFLSAGMFYRKEMLISLLASLLSPKHIVDKTPEKIQNLEQFTPTRGLCYGSPFDTYSFKERGFSFEIPESIGQKTGFYFDQRVLRSRVEELSQNKRVLDAYSYVGSFGLSAARGGASSVDSVDDSALALEVAATLAEKNGVSHLCHQIKADARTFLKESKGGYDLTLVDPPRLAPTKASLEKALGHYTHLAELGAKATVPYGLMVFCSCSGAVDISTLTRAFSLGVHRANRQARIIERHFQGPDHPVLSSFGEGLYLKSIIAQILPK